MKIYYNNGEIFKQEYTKKDSSDEYYYHTTINHDGLISDYYSSKKIEEKDPLSYICSYKGDNLKVYKSSNQLRKLLGLERTGKPTPLLIRKSPIKLFIGTGYYEGDTDTPPELFFNIDSYEHLCEISDYFNLVNPLSLELGADLDSNKYLWSFRRIGMEGEKLCVCMCSIKLDKETGQPTVIKAYNYSEDK